jgi:hypothetical protein
VASKPPAMPPPVTLTRQPPQAIPDPAESMREEIFELDQPTTVVALTVRKWLARPKHAPTDDADGFEPVLIAALITAEKLLPWKAPANRGIAVLLVVFGLSGGARARARAGARHPGLLPGDAGNGSDGRPLEVR